jgi:hypothetical protein
MKKYQKSNVNNRRPGPTVGGRSQRWVSGAGPEPTSSPNAQRNYERYLALARAEAQNGNTVAAENYYQHAEHYFRSDVVGQSEIVGFDRDLGAPTLEVSASIRCEHTDDECNGLLTGRVRGRSKFLFICDLRLGADAHSRKEPECRHYGKNSAQDQKEIAEH